MPALLVVIQDIHALGLKAAQGLVTTDFGYWDLNDETRAFSKRFMEKHGTPPNFIHFTDYSATLHYLKAVQAAGTDETQAVVAKMRELKINDPVTKDGWIRADGRVMRNAYLVQVKSPAEFKGAVGRVQDPCHHPAGGVDPAAGSGRLSAGQEGLTARPSPRLSPRGRGS